MRLKDQVALLTGATDGIGKATAIRFVREGARVVFTGRSQAKGSRALQELAAAGGEGCAVFVQCDVTDEKAALLAVNTVLEKFGRLNILVNCAAAQAGGTVLDAKPEDYDHIFRTNVMGYGLSAKVAIPQLLKNPGSAIVNIASLNGNVGTVSRTLYNASKAAVIEMTRSMAIDFPTIRVNCVSPGFTRSDAMMAGLASTGLDPDECASLISRGVIMRRMATPDEIAAVILFLASSDASYITGENIMADGGALCFGNYGAALETDPRLAKKH
jgi:NAD(P)-dependent dehydrogenase (short-subunit alcohol dehydrogenase family)